MALTKIEGTKPPIKEWIKALRSGEYRQGSLYLERYGNFCALGVLCDLYIKHRKIKNKQSILLWKTPPKAVRDWAGIPIGFMYEIMRLNDDERESFSEIADFIEEKIQ